MLWAGWTAPGRGRLRGETWSAPAWAPPSRSPPAAGSPAPTMRARCTSPSTCSSRSRARGPRRRGWSCSPGGRRLEPRRPQVSPPGPGPGGAGAGGLVGGVAVLDKALCSSAGNQQALLGPEGATAHSTATLRILASMPSRTIGERGPWPPPGTDRSPWAGWGRRAAVSRRAGPFSPLPPSAARAQPAPQPPGLSQG